MRKLYSYKGRYKVAVLRIPQANPRASYLNYQSAIDQAIASVLNRGWYILGDEVKQFEQEFAAWNDFPSVVGAGSGTDAIELMIRALGLEPDAEIITSTHTASATVAAIERANAVPVLVDIDPRTFNLDPALVKAAITDKTRVVMPIHLYGQPADLARLSDIASQHQLVMLEDCAQAHGARYRGQHVGTFGTMAAFSFYPTKNLGALGDGGAVGVGDPSFEGKVRSLAQYGWTNRYISDEPGMNSRLDEIQAAVLRVKLRHLDNDNARRRAIAARYDAGLFEYGITPFVPEGCEPVFHLYVIQVPERDALRSSLEAVGIGTAVQYPAPIHLQPAYRGRLGDLGSFPHAEKAVQEIVSLPLYPELTDSEVDDVIAGVRSFLS